MPSSGCSESFAVSLQRLQKRLAAFTSSSSCYSKPDVLQHETGSEGQKRGPGAWGMLQGGLSPTIMLE